METQANFCLALKPLFLGTRFHLGAASMRATLEDGIRRLSR